MKISLPRRWVRISVKNSGPERHENDVIWAKKNLMIVAAAGGGDATVKDFDLRRELVCNPRNEVGKENAEADRKEQGDRERRRVHGRVEVS